MEKEAFFSKLAGVLEADPAQVGENFALTPENWDSLAVLGAIALIDECFSATVPAFALNECRSVKELWRLVETAHPETGS